MSELRRVLGVLELGLPPAELADRYPGYAQMIIDWLAPALPEVEYRVIETVRGAPLPALDELDGVIYSGSRYGVYDDVPWIAPLQTFIRQIAALGRPQFGICFGHQVIAEALGGHARKAAGGWNCGMQEYRLAERIAGAERLRMLVMHQDQVLELAPGARVLGGSDACPIGIVEHAQATRSVQFHPEFSPDFVAALLDIYGGSVIPTPIARRAMSTLPSGLDRDLVATWTATFFRNHFGPDDVADQAEMAEPDD